MRYCKIGYRGTLEMNCMISDGIRMEFGILGWEALFIPSCKRLEALFIISFR